MPSQIIVYESPTEVAHAAADWVVEQAAAAIREKGRFAWSLSGGNTPRMLYSRLGADPYLSRVDWRSTDIFWGDERCVPFDHPDSDFGMAHETLLSKIPAGQTPRSYRLIGELDPQKAAASYEALLQGYFGAAPTASFDLLLLGMGDDGHTASLFPGTPAIHEAEHWVRAHFVPKLDTWRLTLTPPILNLARQTLFLVTGANKRDVLKAVREGAYQPDVYPSQVIQPLNGQLTWLVDRAAAGG